MSPTLYDVQVLETGAKKGEITPKIKKASSALTIASVITKVGPYIQGVTGQAQWGG
jgi:hypothetical protein